MRRRRHNREKEIKSIHILCPLLVCNVLSPAWGRGWPYLEVFPSHTISYWTWSLAWTLHKHLMTQEGLCMVEKHQHMPVIWVCQVPWGTQSLFIGMGSLRHGVSWVLKLISVHGCFPLLLHFLTAFFPGTGMPTLTWIPDARLGTTPGDTCLFISTGRIVHLLHKAF